MGLGLGLGLGLGFGFGFGLGLGLVARLGALLAREAHRRLHLVEPRLHRLVTVSARVRVRVRVRVKVRVRGKGRVKVSPSPSPSPRLTWCGEDSVGAPVPVARREGTRRSGEG